MLVITVNETNENKITLSSNDISIEINNENKIHNIVNSQDSQSSTMKQTELTEIGFDDPLDITKLKEKQYKKKSIWDIDVPTKELKKYLFSYYQKKIKTNSQENIRRINKITNIFYNLIDNLHNDPLKFENIFITKSKNKQLEYLTKQQFGIDWIYPIVNDRKKLYKYLQPSKDDLKDQTPQLIPDTTRCYIPNELNYFHKLNLNFDVSLQNFLQELIDSEQILEENKTKLLTLFRNIYQKIYNFMLNHNYLFDTKEFTLITSLQEIYNKFPQIIEIDLTQTSEFNKLYLHILQFTEEELEIYNKYIDFFNNLLNNKELFFTNDYLIVKHNEELDVYNHLLTQLYNRESRLNFTKPTNGQSEFGNLLHNGGICETNLETMQKLIPILRNYVNHNDLQIVNETTIPTQFKNTIEVVRQTSLFDQTYKMTSQSNPEKRVPEKIKNNIDIRKLNKIEYYPKYEISQRKSNSSYCGNKKQLKLYIDQIYNNNENITFTKNEKVYHIDWYPIKKPSTEELFMEGETVNVVGYYIDNQKKHNWNSKKNYLQKKQINVKTNYILEKQIPDGFSINDIINHNVDNKVKLANLKYANTIKDTKNINQYLNHAILFSECDDLITEIRKKVIEDNKTTQIQLTESTIQKKVFQLLNTYLLEKIIPNPLNIETKVDFNKVSNISNVNKLLSPFGFDYNDLPINLIKKIELIINKNISKIMNHESLLQQEKKTDTNQTKFFNSIKQNLFNLIVKTNYYYHLTIHNYDNEQNKEKLQESLDTLHQLETNYKPVLEEYLENLFFDNIQLYKQFADYLNIYEFNKQLIYLEDNSDYTKQNVLFYLQIMLNQSKLKIVSLKDNLIIVKLNHSTTKSIQKFHVLNKIKHLLSFSNKQDELFYYRNLIVNYIDFRYKHNYVDTQFCIDEKNILFFKDSEDNEEDSEEESEDREDTLKCDFTSLSEIKNYYNLSDDLFEHYKGSLHNYSNFLHKYIANSQDSGKLFSLFKEYLFKCTESKEYKKLIEKIAIEKINKCNNIETLEKQPKFNSIRQILKHNEEANEDNQFDFEEYIDSIKLYNLPSYLNQIEMLILMIQKTIENYNLYGNHIQIVKVFSNQDEMVEFNSDKNKDKIMKKDDDKINHSYYDILLSIIQEYTIEDLSEKGNLINDIYINHKTKISKEFSYYLFIDGEMTLEEKQIYVEQMISKLLFQKKELENVSIGDYAALFNEIEVTNETGELITTNEILLYKLIINSADIKTWQQQEIQIPGSSSQINLENEEELLHFEQLQYLKDIFTILQNLHTDINLEQFNHNFSDYRCEAIIQYLKKKNYNTKVKKYLITLLTKLFEVVDKYVNIKTILDNIDEIFITKNDLLSNIEKIQRIQRKKNIDKYTLAFQHKINKKEEKITDISTTTVNEDHKIAEDYLYDLLTKVNKQSNDKVILEKLKHFIDRHGILDEKNHQIKWIDTKETMICYHYYDLTKQLSTNENTETFFRHFHSKYCNIQFTNEDNLIYCKYCQEAITTQKESSNEGYMREGGLITVREQIEEDIITDNIEDRPEWKQLKLTTNDIQTLRYTTEFLKRINITLKYDDLKDIVYFTSKQLSKLNRFNVDFLKKHEKTIFQKFSKENDTIKFDKFIEFLNKVNTNTDNLLTIDIKTILELCNDKTKLNMFETNTSSKPKTQSGAGIQFSYEINGGDSDSDESDTELQSNITSLINLFGGSDEKKKKKGKKSKKKPSLRDKLKKKKKEKVKKKESKIKKRQQKTKVNSLYCKIFKDYLQHFNFTVTKFKLFTIISIIYIKLQVAIPDYKNYKIGGEREARFSYLITDFYNDTKSLQQLFTNLLINDKTILSTKIKPTNINYPLLKITKNDIKTNIQTFIKDNKQLLEKEYERKKRYRQSLLTQEVKSKKEWVTFKPPMKLTKQNNKVLHLLKKAVELHPKINNYHNYISPISIQKLKNPFSYLYFEKVNFDKDTNIYDQITNEIKTQIRSTQTHFENVIYPPKKDELFLHKPLHYINNVKFTSDMIITKIKELVHKYSIEFTINSEEGIIELAQNKIEKRQFITIKKEIVQDTDSDSNDFQSDFSSIETITENKYEENDYDMVTGNTKTYIMENIVKIIDKLLFDLEDEEAKKTQLTVLYDSIVTKINDSKSLSNYQIQLPKNNNQIIEEIVNLLNCNTKSTLQIDKISCFIKDILTNKKNIQNLQQFENDENFNFLRLLETINIQDKQKENKFTKEALQNIKLNLILEDINQFVHKQKYKKRLTEGFNLQIMFQMNIEIKLITRFIKTIIFYLGLINNKYNKIQNFVGRQKNVETETETENVEPTDWIDINNVASFKKIKNDYPSVSQKAFSSMNKVNTTMYTPFYEMLQQLQTDTKYNFENIQNIFQDNFINDLVTILNLTKQLQYQNSLYDLELLNSEQLTSHKLLIISKLIFVMIIEKIKETIQNEVVLTNILYYFHEHFKSIITISLQTQSEIDNSLNEDKAKDNEARKQNFNRKTISEQNIHNIRRQFNLGNVEDALQQELQEVLNSEDILDRMNDSLNVIEQQETIETDFNPNISHINGEDNHDYKDIYD